MDPSRTSTLRRQFEEELIKRYNRLKAKIIALVGKGDAFGLKNAPTRNAQCFINNGDYSSTQFNVDNPYIAAPLITLQENLDPDDVIEVEKQLHVTVKYGLHALTPDTVERLVSQSGLIWARLGQLSLFRSPEQDVLKISIESEPLRGMNRLLSLLPNTTKFPDYQPHLTLAYLKPGTGDKYLNYPLFFQDRTLIFTTLTFSTPEREQTPIALNYGRHEITWNTRWKFNRTTEQVEAFRSWLAEQIDAEIVPVNKTANDPGWWKKYVQDGYRKGAARAFDDARPREGDDKKLDFYKGTKSEFLRSSFSQAETIEKVELLAGRVFTDLKGVNDSMAAQMTRSLIDGLIQGKGPFEIADQLAADVDMPLSRARMIARTEIIRAHSEGALDSLEAMGMDKIGVMVEWSTAGHNVCKLCRALEGVVLTIKEARGMFPRHPNCKCTPIPANVGEDRSRQTRGPKGVRDAIDSSIAAEMPKTKKRTFQEQKRMSNWSGADARVATKRPKAIVK